MLHFIAYVLKILEATIIKFVLIIDSELLAFITRQPSIDINLYNSSDEKTSSETYILCLLDTFSRTVAQNLCSSLGCMPLLFTKNRSLNSMIWIERHAGQKSEVLVDFLNGMWVMIIWRIWSSRLERIGHIVNVLWLSCRMNRKVDLLFLDYNFFMYFFV